MQRQCVYFNLTNFHFQFDTSEKCIVMKKRAKVKLTNVIHLTLAIPVYLREVYKEKNSNIFTGV